MGFPTWDAIDPKNTARNDGSSILTGFRHSEIKYGRYHEKRHGE